MELAASSAQRAQTLPAAPRIEGRAVGAWLLGLAPVLYLALRGGGYDLVVRSEVTLAAWWLVLLGVLAGVMPIRRIGRTGWAGLALFAGFVIWTLLATGWSVSVERTVDELGRVAGYLGFLALGLCVLRRDTLRPLINGMAVAFGVVALLAVLSRLYPASFPVDQSLLFQGGTASRLDYPLNYSNGTGAFLAMGIPLLAVVATRARKIVTQVIAAAAIPVAVLALVMTASRTGVISAIVGIVVFYALTPVRLPKLLTGLAVGAGSTVLVVGLVHRAALHNGEVSAAAAAQRHHMAALVLITCIGVALLQTAIAMTLRYGVPARVLRLSRRQALGATVIVVVVAVVIALAAGVPHTLSHQWSEFKKVNVPANTSVYGRLGTVAGSHRYQYWKAAIKAFDSHPVDGIGPGTYEFYWAQHGSIYEFIRNAHSLYVETMAEAGIIGLLLIVGLLATILIAGVIRALRGPPLTRTLVAGATASFAAFCVAAGIDWVWQLPAIAIAALLLGAGILSAGRERRRQAESPRAVAWGGRAATALVALAAIVAVAIPLAATTSIRSSQAEVQAGQLQAALSDAATAQRLEPYAATPRLQRALILEQAHDLPGARAAIAEAASREPTNWRIWLIRSRIEAESGHAAAAVRYYKRAHALNPLSPSTSLNA